MLPRDWHWLEYQAKHSITKTATVKCDQQVVLVGLNCWVSLLFMDCLCTLFQRQNGRPENNSKWNQVPFWRPLRHGCHAICTGELVGLISVLLIITLYLKPLDLVKTRMQVAKSSGGAKPSTVSLIISLCLCYLKYVFFQFGVITSVIKNEGITTLYNGKYFFP